MRAKCYIPNLHAKRAENFYIFLTFAPPIRKMDRRPCVRVCMYMCLCVCVQGHVVYIHYAADRTRFQRARVAIRQWRKSRDEKSRHFCG